MSRKYSFGYRGKMGKRAYTAREIIRMPKVKFKSLTRTGFILKQVI